MVTPVTPPARSAPVVVIGAGVIGTAIAHALTERGVPVTLLEQDEPGRGCSYGNAGWITPCFALPLPMPGMFATALRWLGDPASPFYIQPRPSLSLVQWLVRFLAAMNERQFEASARALTELSRASLADYHALAARYGDFAFEARGLSIACESRDGLAMAEHERALAEQHGVRGEPLSAEALRARVPALRGDVIGGVHFPDEAHLDPHRFVQSLARAVQQRGGTIVTQCTVQGIASEGRRVTHVRTSRGDFAASQVVLATGSWSKALGRVLGLRIPVLGGKGYSMIAPNAAPPVTAPLYLIERRVAITPRCARVRIAGTLEIVDGDRRISPRRFAAIRDGACAMLAFPEPLVLEESWAGLRPCTPDGVPLIGFSPRHDNLLLAAGHQMLGMQTAPATARLATELLLGEKPSYDPQPFSPARF